MTESANIVPGEIVDGRPELTVVVPVFNEADSLDNLIARLVPAIEACVTSYQIVFVDDGSSDASLAKLTALHARNARIETVSFSRNFGKEIAIAAGLDHARGRAAVIMDADLQHPPEVIAEFVARWREGYKNVFGQRLARDTDTRLRRALSRRFYRLFDRFGETALPQGAGDFRLLDRQAIDALQSMRERARFTKGLYAWIGFRTIGVPFTVEERATGVSKFSYRKLTRFALDGIMSFSTMPLKVWTFVGVTISVIALFTALLFVVQTIVNGVDVPGYASLIVSVMFFAGVQLLSLGVLGEYIGRIFAEVKKRPLYIVSETVSDIPQAAPRPER